MKRSLLSLVTIVAICLAVAIPLYAEDDFSMAVHRISDRLGQRPMRIPFLGVILFFTPVRGSHLKLATFENTHTQLSLADVEASLKGTLDGSWRPFVRVDSRPDHECTVIYARVVGGEMRLMVINAERSEVTVVQMDVPKRLQGSWLDDTRKMAHKHRHGETEDSDGDGA